MPPLPNALLPAFARIYTHPTWTSAAQIPDLTGRTALVTGATSGLGFETALQLALRGANVYVGARSRAKGEEAVARIKEMAGRVGGIWCFVVDLGDLRATHNAALSLLSQSPRPTLDILINNAGSTPRGLTLSPSPPHYETTVLTNHLAPFLLTTTLLPLLAPYARIVNVSSQAHTQCVERPVFSSNLLRPSPTTTAVSQPGLPTTPEARYAHAKLCTLLFTRGLQRRLLGAYVNACHPGTVRTRLNREVERVPVVGVLVRAAMRVIGVDVATGALTQLWLATAPEVEVGGGIRGEYFVPVARRAERGRREQVSDWFWDDELVEECWRWSEEAVRKGLSEDPGAGR